MADSVATLFVEVNSRDVTRATAQLRSFDRQASSTEKQTNRLSGGFNSLSNAVNAFAGAFAAREIVQALDTYTLIENRLKNVTKSSEELLEVQNALFNVAQETRQSLSGTVDLYARFAVASDAIGISQERLLNITRALQQAFVVSGATTQEASAAVVQLGQAIGAGQLRGQEFNSIAEQGVRILFALQDSLGLTTGELRDLANQGGLTREVFLDAFEKQIPVIGKEFEKLDSTVGQSVTKLTNSLINFSGKLDNATGSSDALAGSITALSESIDSLAEFDAGTLESGAVASVGIVGAILFGAEIATVVGTIVAINEGVKSIDSSLRSLGGVFSNVDTSIGGIFTKFSDLVDIWGEITAPPAGLPDTLGQLREMERILSERVIPAVEKASKEYKNTFGPSIAEFNKFQEKQIEIARKVREQERENALDRARLSQERNQDLEEYLQLLEERAETELRTSREGADGAIRALQDIQDAAGDTATQVEDAVGNAFSSLEDSIVDTVRTGKIEFSSLADSIINDLIRIAVQQSITQPLAQAGAGLIGSFFHSGGKVGSGGRQASVPASAFAGAPRMHSGGVAGLASDEVPAILQRGEVVLSRDQVRGAATSLPSTTTNVFIENNTGGEVTTERRQNETGGEDITVIIGQIVDRNLSAGVHDDRMLELFGRPRRGR